MSEEPPSATVAGNPALAKLDTEWMALVTRCHAEPFFGTADLVLKSKEYARAVIEALEGRIEWGKRNDKPAVVLGAEERLKYTRPVLAALDALSNTSERKKVLAACMSVH